MNLRKSPVIFNETEHTYTLNGVQLSGITGLIDRQIYGGKYKGVSEEVLNAKALRGSIIHGMLEVASLGLHTPDPEYPEVDSALRVMGSQIANGIPEYLVSDETHFATKIDLVHDLDLYDYKTTYSLDKDSLSWQLSIAGYLFEIQNGVEPRNFYGVHLKGDSCVVVPIDKKPKEAVKALLDAEREGVQYTPMTSENALRCLFDLEQAIIDIKTEAEVMENRKKQLVEGLLVQMEMGGLKSLESDRLKITMVAPTVAKTFDSKRFGEEHPEMYGQYVRETEKKGSVRITIKK